MFRLLLFVGVLLSSPVQSLAAPVVRADQPPVLLVFGDSLSAGYGLDRPSEGWVALLDGRLREAGLGWRVVNASVSGETTAGGLTRLPAVLARERPALVILQLGANDGLRGLDLERMAANLHAMIERSRAAGGRVLLVGNRLPPNYGAAYTERFQAVFEAVAEEAGVALVPALLAGVAERWDLMQPDGVHPTAPAQPQLLENVWSVLAPLLDAEAPR